MHVKWSHLNRMIWLLNNRFIQISKQCQLDVPHLHRRCSRGNKENASKISPNIARSGWKCRMEQYTMGIDAFNPATSISNATLSFRRCLLCAVYIMFCTYQTIYRRKMPETIKLLIFRSCDYLRRMFSSVRKTYIRSILPRSFYRELLSEAHFASNVFLAQKSSGDKR